MRNKRPALIVALSLGILLLLTQGRWLPFVLSKLNFVQEHSDFIQGIDAFINIGLLFINAITAYLLWLSRADNPQDFNQGRGALQTEPKRTDGIGSIHEAPEPSIVPVERLLRSAVPNLGSPEGNNSDWTRSRLREVLDGLRWIDRDCGFEAEDYMGLKLVVRSARIPSSYTIVKVSTVDVLMRTEGIRAQSKDTRLEEYRSKDIHDIFTKLSDPMVLLGDPGSGKSVSLRHLGQIIVKNQLRHRISKKTLIPIYIHLAGCRRDQAGSRFAHIQVLIWCFTDRISNDGPFSGHFQSDLGQEIAIQASFLFSPTSC